MMTRDSEERIILVMLMSIIVLALLFGLFAFRCPECMPWHRPNARHVFSAHPFLPDLQTGEETVVAFAAGIS
jgi:hypothetical protein